MTNVPYPPGSGRVPTASYPSGPSIITYPRRSSYASIVAGPGNAHHPPAWSGAPPSVGTATPSSSYPPQYNRLHGRGYSLDEEMLMNGGGTGGNNRRRSGLLPEHSRQFIKALAYATGTNFLNKSSQFFTPSYLKSSKYVAQLAAANDSKNTAHKDSSSVHSSNAPSLSTNSSHVNLHRMAPSHRGMTYDIIEHNLPGEDEPLSPLPSRWNESDKYSGLDVLGDGLEIRYMGPANKPDHEAAAVRANHPMPPQCGIYYYEVTMLAKSTEGYVLLAFLISSMNVC